MLNKAKFLMGLSLILAMSSHSAIAAPTQTKETPNRATVIANWFGYSELEYLELSKTSLPSSYEFIAHDGYFGFVPVSVAPTPEKATEYLVSAFEKATEMAIKEHFLDYEIKTFPAFWTDPAEGIGTTKKLEWGVGLINPKQGCVAPGEPEYKQNYCIIQFRSGVPKKKMALPSQIGTSDEQFWLVTQKEIFEKDMEFSVKFFKGNNVKKMPEPEELLPHVAKYMPKNTYVYLAPRLVGDKVSQAALFEGNARQSPPTSAGGRIAQTSAF